MKTGIKGFVAVMVLAGIMALAQSAAADRGGWSDPAGGWDVVFEGDYPTVAAMGADGWYQSNASGDPGTDGNYTTWGDWDLADTVFLSVPGQGEIERGVTTGTALVFQVRDNDTAGDGVVRRFKAGKPFAGTYNTQADDLLRREGGVTILMRFKIMTGAAFPFLEPDSGSGERVYRAETVGFDGATGVNGTAGIGVGPNSARWCRDDNSVSTNIETGDLTNGFHTFWIVIEPVPGNLDNYAGRLYVDGAVVPAVPKWQGPGDNGPDGTYNGVADDLTVTWYSQSDRFAPATFPALDGKAMAYFGPSRSGAMITIQYDYILWKKGAHVPTASGPPAAPTNLTVGIVAGRVELNWNDNSSNEDGFAMERRTSGTATWTEVDRTAADVETYRDSGLLPDTTYFYRVRAFHGTDFSGYSNEVSIRTPAGSLGARTWRRYSEE
jgi:hypothetical protein